jgi:type IV pilus assembly protein PilC
VPKYLYKARSPSGELITGERIAPSELDLRDVLQAQGLFTVQVQPVVERPSVLAPLLAKFKGVSLRDLNIFCWQLSAMLNAGITLVRALEISAKQITNPRLKLIIQDISRSIAQGETFSRSLSKYPNIFSRFFIGMVEVGEASGTLDQTLKEISKYLEGQADLRNKVLSAFAYPVFLVVACGLAITFLIIFVFPKISQVLIESGATIPLSTQILMSIGDLSTKYSYIFLPSLAAFILGCWMFLATPLFKPQKDLLLLNLPLFGPLVTKLMLARFTMSLNTLVRNGITLLSALEITEGIVTNVHLQAVMRGLKGQIQQGKPLSEPLAQSRIIPEMVSEMVGVGEESGKLDEMLAKVSDYYLMDVDYTIKSLVRFIEPALIVFVTLMVGFLAASVFLPIAEISTNLGK